MTIITRDPSTVISREEVLRVFKNNEDALANLLSRHNIPNTDQLNEKDFLTALYVECEVAMFSLLEGNDSPLLESHIENAIAEIAEYKRQVANRIKQSGWELPE